MDQPQAPLVVNPSTVPDVTNTVVRDIAIVAAAFPILVKLIGARDLTGLLHWLQSSDGATVVAIVVPIVLTTWRSWRSRNRKVEMVTLANVAPDRIAVVATPANVVDPAAPVPPSGRG